MGQDLLTSRNVLFVAFLDANDRPLTFASRESQFDWGHFQKVKNNTESLMRVRRDYSTLFGEHIEIVVPVLSAATTAPMARAVGFTPDRQGADGGSRLIGYVAVGLSQAREQQQLMQVNYSIIGIGCLLLVIALPLAYTMVRRVFYPIRQLVDATIQIARGDFETQVAVHRPDVIGVLARTFNQMVARICLQQRQLEQSNQQLADANQDLEGKVLHRTALLETANRRLSSEIEEKEDFLRAISHDLNAPLRNIAGMAAMLLHKHRAGMDPDVVHRLERIQKNVEVESDLIGELLELSRLKTRRQKMEMVEVEAMVRELGEILDNDLRTGNIKLIIDTSLPVLMCERARLRQVFQNLIDNAIKYMGEGTPSPDGPTKEIHVGCTLRAGEAEFYVRDTGVGIHPDDVAKVFVVFRRGKNSPTCGAPGKGVGLASVKSIVEMYSGAIWVESELGRGSTFRFTMNGKHVPACACGHEKSTHLEEAVEMAAPPGGSAIMQWP
jgi:signal transduction histidine kinase